MPQIDNTSENVQNMLKADGIVEELQKNVTKLQSDVGDRSGHNLNLTEQVDGIHRRQDGYVSGSVAVPRAERDKNWNFIHETYATIDSLMKKSPLILSLKQDTTTKEYQIVNSNGEQVLFDEIFTEAQSRPVYCYAKDRVTLLPLSVLNSSMIMFIGSPYGAGEVNYCEIQYSGESGNVLVDEKPLIVPEMNDNLDEGIYLRSAPSLHYLEEYMNRRSSKIIDKHINQYPDKTIKSNEILDTCYGDGLIYRLVVYDNDLPDVIGYGWLFVNYIQIPEYDWSQILIDLDGQILSRYKVNSDWTEWQPIGNGGDTNITVDAILDSKSINPVQNKVISDYLNALNYYGNMDFRPSSDSHFKFSGGSVESYNGALMEVIVPYYYYYDNNFVIVGEIGINAFQGNNLVESIVLPNTIEFIAAAAFAECSILAKIRLSNRLSSLSDQVFLGCENLTSITLPNSIVSIGANVFDGSGLTDVYYEGTKEQWESITILEDNDTLNNATIHFNWVATETYATKSEVGDISTALDAIIAIDNKLLGVSE